LPTKIAVVGLNGILPLVNCVGTHTNLILGILLWNRLIESRYFICGVTRSHSLI
jgi:hypothetical protein